MEIQVTNRERKYDVIVAGGGPAGIAAAIKAARGGAKTLIVEQTTALGGMATVGMVSRMTRYTDQQNLLYHSFALEMLDRYKAFVGFNPNFYGKTPLYTEELKLVLDEMVTEAGVEVLFQSMVCSVVREDNEIKALIVANKDGLTPYTAHTYIDCTGDGDVAALCGVPFEKGDEEGRMQPLSLCYVISGVDLSLLPVPGDILSVSTMKWKEQWKVIAADERFPLVKAHFVPVLQGNNIVYVNAGHIFDVDSTDPVAMSNAYMLGRRIAHETVEALKVYVPGAFENAYVTATAPLMGIRESRRIVGDFRLTVDDYINQATFPDEVGRNHNWLDNHTSPGQKNTVKGLKLAPGESHGIPYRMVLPHGVSNLLVAGRCSSMDRRVFASMRVMPNCIVLGEAAGIAAGLSVTKGIAVNMVDLVEVAAKIEPMPEGVIPDEENYILK